MLRHSVIFILQNSGRRAWSQHLHQLPCKVALQNSSSIPSVLKTSRSWAVPHSVPVTAHVVQVRWTEKINYAPVRSYDWLAYGEVARNHMAYKPRQIFQRRTVQKELGEPLRFIKRIMYKKQVELVARPLPKSCALKRTHGRHTTYGAGRSYMETLLNCGLARIHVRLAQIRVWLEWVTTLTRRQRLWSF